MNRFKGLDLVDSGPEELSTEAHNIGQEAVTKTIPKKKKCKKATQLFEETQLTALERKEAKKQGRKKKMHPTERTVPENSKETEEGFLNERLEGKKNYYLDKAIEFIKKQFSLQQIEVVFQNIHSLLPYTVVLYI